MTKWIRATTLLLGVPAGLYAQPRPSSCLIQPDKTVAAKPAAGRSVYCGLDIGSRSVKLSVVSLENGRTTSMRDERQCKRSLGMGALVFDSRAGTARALPSDAIGYLVDTIRDYQQICALDAGRVVAAGATQWARDATNIADVQARVKAETGVTFDVLSSKQEAEYSYAAASLNTPGRLVLDSGSNSFEIAWQEKGSSRIHSILVEHGYVRAAATEFASAPDFAAGRAAYQANAKARIEEQLAKLTPPMSLVALRKLMRAGKVGPEILALGQDGAAVQLAVRGVLRDGSEGWIADPKTHDDVLSRQSFKSDPVFGIITAAPVSAAETSDFLNGLQSADFKILMSEPVRSLYGEKALAVPALLDLLFRELGAPRVVLVPQEMTTGHILTKLHRP